MFGLQGWAQAELRRSRVQDLPTALAAADALVDFCFDRTMETSKIRVGKRGLEPRTSKDKKHKELGNSKLSGQATSRNGVEESWKDLIPRTGLLHLRRSSSRQGLSE